MLVVSRQTSLGLSHSNEGQYCVHKSYLYQVATQVSGIVHMLCVFTGGCSGFRGKSMASA